MAKMVNLADFVFYDMCRLCLDNRGYCEVFAKEDLIEDIFKCTGVNVSLLDCLPQKICEKCLNIVTKAKELRIMAAKNDVHLRSIHYGQDIPLSKEATNNTAVESNTAPKDTIHPVIVSFLRVRNDLYESSVPIDSTEELSEPKSSLKPNSLPVKPEIDKTLDEYKCENCSKVFNKWKKFYLHKRLHTKNYICSKNGCKKKFASKGDLEKHIRTHTGEKPFICDKCYKGFSQRITMKKHKETVHCDDASTSVDASAIS